VIQLPFVCHGEGKRVSHVATRNFDRPKFLKDLNKRTRVSNLMPKPLIQNIKNMCESNNIGENTFQAMKVTTRGNKSFTPSKKDTILNPLSIYDPCNFGKQ
jgi:hypothetical protein